MARQFKNKAQFQEWLKTASEDEIADVVADFNAEDQLQEMLPQIVLSVARDGMKEEQEAFDEPEAEDSPDNEVEGASYEATLKASVDYWNNVKRQNSQRAYAKSSGVYTPVPTAVRNKAKAADSVALNAKRSRKGTYSMFAHPERSRKAS